MSEWKKYKLGDVTEWKSGGTPLKANKRFWNGSIAWISAKNLTSSRISTSDIFISEAGLHNGSRLARKGDLLLLVRGSGLYNDIPIAIVEKPVAFNQDVKAITTIRELVNPWFLLYWLVANKKLLNTKLEATGIGAGKFDINILKGLNVYLPSIYEQQKIAEVARLWDDKIELNRRMNQTLEQMAKALFNHYFVDNIDPDNLPEGWKWGRVEDLFVLQRGFDLPALERTHGKHPVFAASGLNGYHETAMVKGPGITTGRSGVIGNVFYIIEDFWPLNTSLYIKEFRASTPLHAFYVLKSLDLKGLNGGSAVPTLNRNHVHSLEVVIPAEEKIIEFQNKVESLFLLKRKNEQQSSTLTTIRDALLPKLMSGEIDIPVLDDAMITEPT